MCTLLDWTLWARIRAGAATRRRATHASDASRIAHRIAVVACFAFALADTPRATVKDAHSERESSIVCRLRAQRCEWNHDVKHAAHDAREE